MMAQEKHGVKNLAGKAGEAECIRLSSGVVTRTSRRNMESAPGLLAESPHSDMVWAGWAESLTNEPK